MKLSITSSSGVILSADSFVRVTIMTEDGEVTILTGHEPLLSAVRPGILYTEYHIGNKVHTAEYATGGGVLNISPESGTIGADVVESDDHLTDLEYIASQKAEAEKMMREYQEENGTVIDPKRLIELEDELLKYTAMHRLGQKFHEQGGSRK